MEVRTIWGHKWPTNETEKRARWQVEGTIALDLSDLWAEPNAH